MPPGMLPTLVGLGLGILLTLLLGVLFARGKGAGLIAGYNTMTDEEQKSIDLPRLMRYASRAMFGCAGCLGLMLTGVLLSLIWLAHAGMLLFAGIIVTTIVLSNRCRR